MIGALVSMALCGALSLTLAAIGVYAAHETDGGPLIRFGWALIALLGAANCFMAASRIAQVTL